MYFVIATMNKDDGVFKSLGNIVENARVFYLIRAEPLYNNPSLEYFLPPLPTFDKGKEDNHVYFSVKESKDVTGRA